MTKFLFSLLIVAAFGIVPKANAVVSPVDIDALALDATLGLDFSGECHGVPATA